MLNEFNVAKKAYFPKSVYFGELSKLWTSLEPQNYILLASKTAFNNHGSVFRKIKNKSKIVFVSSEPNTTEVDRCFHIVRKYRSSKTLVAFGGGSVIDVAKLVNNKLQLELMAIPTTPGTGSEVTPFAVVIDPNGHKVAQNSQKLIPSIVILDKTLMKTIPQKSLGPMMADIYSHAVEAFLSRLASSYSDSIAISCMMLLNKCLRESKKLDSSYWENIQTAGFLGGMCQAASSTGLIHSLAHYFGPPMNVSHGEAIALFFNKVVVYNSSQQIVAKKLNDFNLSTMKILKTFNEIHKAFPFVIPTMGVLNSTEINTALNDIQHDVGILTNPIRPNREQLISLLS